MIPEVVRQVTYEHIGMGLSVDGFPALYERVAGAHLDGIESDPCRGLDRDQLRAEMARAAAGRDIARWVWLCETFWDGCSREELEFHNAALRRLRAAMKDGGLRPGSPDFAARMLAMAREIVGLGGSAPQQTTAEKGGTDAGE